MIEIGVYHTLTILRSTDPGLFLGDEEENEVLLPNRYVPEEFNIGDPIKVFVYLDNEERPVATTTMPHITKGDFALLRCNQVTKFGAFMDWGLVKELFCPFKEQVFKMKEGNWYLVHCYEDKETNRLVASSRTNKFLDNKELTVKMFDEVDLIVSHPSDKGMNVIVNKKHLGLIYKEDLFADIYVGDKHKGIVKKVRLDNKLDITLGQLGYRSIEPNSQIVLNALEDHQGYLALSDHSSPEDIKEALQMSKKNFKKAIGNLYKQKRIKITDEGIYLLKEPEN